jgi:hypothetical protein
VCVCVCVCVCKDTVKTELGKGYLLYCSVTTFTEGLGETIFVK